MYDTVRLIPEMHFLVRLVLAAGVPNGGTEVTASVELGAWRWITVPLVMT